MENVNVHGRFGGQVLALMTLVMTGMCCRSTTNAPPRRVPRLGVTTAVVRRRVLCVFLRLWAVV